MPSMLGMFELAVHYCTEVVPGSLVLQGVQPRMPIAQAC
jgi:hypothetical protein